MLEAVISMNRMKAAFFGLWIVACMLDAPVSKAQQANAPADRGHASALTVNQVVARLEERNRERATALKKFQGTRTYSIQYRGALGARDAEMTVSLKYAAPDEKDFTILSQSGSKFVIEHVLMRLLQEEREASNEENRRRTELSTRNYDFTLAGFEGPPEALQYVLNVAPKTDNKYLYRGKIWVDANDFAVTRIEAEPAKSPSFWIKKSEISHKYENVHGFWLPLENRTDNWIRLGGHALLVIEYKDYKLTETEPIESGQNTRDSTGVGATPREATRKSSD